MANIAEIKMYKKVSDLEERALRQGEREVETGLLHRNTVIQAGPKCKVATVGAMPPPGV